MKEITKPTSVILALSSLVFIAVASPIWCPNMGASKTDLIHSCVNCGLETAKTNGTACSYSAYSSMAAVDCEDGKMFNVDPIGSGSIDSNGHQSNCINYTGGHCSGGVCPDAQAGNSHVVTVNIYYSLNCEG